MSLWDRLPKEYFEPGYKKTYNTNYKAIDEYEKQKKAKEQEKKKQQRANERSDYFNPMNLNSEHSKNIVSAWNKQTQQYNANLISEVRASECVANETNALSATLLFIGAITLALFLIAITKIRRNKKSITNKEYTMSIVHNAMDKSETQCNNNTDNKFFQLLHFWQENNFKERFFKLKNKIIPILYITVLLIQLFFFVPYGKYKVFMSKQNVPHTQLIETAYSSLLDEYYNSYGLQKDANSTTAKPIYTTYKLNVSQFMIQIIITTLIFGSLYLITYKKKED